MLLKHVAFVQQNLHFIIFHPWSRHVWHGFPRSSSVKEKDGILYNPLSTPPCKKMHDRVIHVIHCCTALIFRKAKPAGVEQLSHTVTVFHLVRPLSPPPVTLHKEIIFQRWKFHGLAVTESWKHYRFYRLVVCKTENNGKHKVIIIAV